MSGFAEQTASLGSWFPARTVPLFISTYGQEPHLCQQGFRSEANGFVAGHLPLLRMTDE